MTRTEPDRKTFLDALDRALVREAHARDLDRPPPLDRASPEHDATLRRHFGDDAPLALVAFDTPGIQDFLFGVQRPVDIEGGSRIVEAFVARRPDDRSPDADELASFSILQRLSAESGDAATAESFVYLGGGSGLLAVARSEADAVVATIEDVLRSETRGDLQSVAVALPVWPADLFDPDQAAIQVPAEVATLLGAPASSSRYLACRSGLDALLRRRRSAIATAPADVPRGRAHERCAACGRRTGERESAQHETLCPPCDRRRAVGSKAKRHLDQAKSYEIMVEGLGGGDEGDDPKIAVLYADGANFGAAFRAVANPIEHAALSRAVDAAVQAATAEAVARAGRAFPELGKPWKRHQTPLRGGDDIVLILPARGALEALDALVTAFEATLDERLRAAGLDRPRFRRLGLGVGLVVAEWMFPVQFSLVWAKKLMTSSKRRLRDADGPRSAVDFMVLRSAAPLSEDLDELREQHFESKERGERRTRRPYGIDDFRKLVNRARHLRDRVPPSQVHAMADAIGEGRAVSRNLWRVQHARASGPKSWAAYRSALGGSLEAIGDQLWTEHDDGTWSTDFLDLFDLATLEPKREIADEKGDAA